MNDDDHELHGALSDLASAPPGERERVIREVCARIAAAAAQRAAPKGPDERRRDAPPPAPATEAGATFRSPPAWVAGGDGGHPQTPGPAGAARRPVAVPGHEVAPPASVPPVVQAPASFKRTAPLPDLSPEVPAKGGAPAAPPPPQRRAAPRTVQSRVMGLGGTTPVGDDAIEKAVASVRSPEPPPLTLREFASLCAELAFQPERRREILARYRVHDEATYAALDAHWRRERAARPETRTAFADDFASYLAWLHAHRA